jgi:hypothetical protein
LPFESGRSNLDAQLNGNNLGGSDAGAALGPGVRRRGPGVSGDLRFFRPPDVSITVGEQASLGPDELLVGDLYFESPAGFWDRGLHALIIRHDRGVARLPIHLR